MKKLIAFIVFFLILAIVSYYLISKSLQGKEEVVKKLVNQDITKITDSKINWNQQVKINLSFAPSIELSDLELIPNQNFSGLKFINIKNVLLQPNSLDLLINSVEVDEIKLNQSNIVLDSFSSPIEETLFGYIKYLDSLAKENNLRQTIRLKIANSTISYGQTKFPFEATVKLNFASRDYEIEGSYKKGEKTTHFNLEISHKNEGQKRLELSIKNRDTKILVDGTLDFSKNKEFFGETRLVIKEDGELKKMLFTDSKGDIEIKGNLKVAGNEVALSDIKASNKKYSISGLIKYKKAEEITAELALNQLSVQNLNLGQSKANLIKTIKELADSYLDVFGGIRTNIKVAIEKFSVNKSAASPLNLRVFTEKNSRQKIDFAEIDWPSYGFNFKFSGIVSDNLIVRLQAKMEKFRELLDLVKIDLTNRFVPLPESVKINADFVLGENNLKVIDSNIKTPNYEFGIKGNIYDANPDAKQTESNFAINFKQLTIDNIDYKNLNKLVDEFKIVSILRELYSVIKNVNITLSADTLNLYGAELTNFNAKFLLKNAIAELNNITFTQDGYQSNAEFRLDFKDFIPMLEGDINLDKINFAKLFESLNLNKENQVESNATPSIWSDVKFSLQKFTNLKSLINIRANDILIGTLNLKDNRLTFRNDERFLYIEKFKSKILDDNFELSLSSTLETVPAFTLGVNSPNTKLNSWLSKLFGINNIYGNFGLNLLINFKGNSLKELFLANAGNLKVSVRDLIVVGYNVNSLVEGLTFAREKADVIPACQQAITKGNLNNQLGSFIANFPISQGKINFYRTELPPHPAYTASFNGDVDLSTLKVDGEYLLSIKALGTFIKARLKGDTSSVKPEWDFSNIENFWLEKFLEKK